MVAPHIEDDSHAPIAALVRRLRPRLVRLLFRFGIAEQDREDLLQDALVDLVVKWPLIHDPERWLFGTVRNKCLHYIRHRHRNIGLVIAVDNSQELERLAGPAPAHHQDEKLDLARLSRSLPARQIRILRLFYGLGLTEGELAQEPGAQHSLHKDRWRAISRLRRALRDGAQ